MNQCFWKNDKVMLRMMEKKDQDLMYQVLKDTSLRMQPEGGISMPCDMETAEDMVWYAQSVSHEGKELWFVILDLENRRVGYAILGDINERDGNVRCDVTIFPKNRRQGYGRSACEILIKYAFYERRLHKVNAHVMAENREGILFLEHLCFVREGRRSAAFYSLGRYHDRINFGITREEFDKKNQALKESLPKDTVKIIEEKNLKPALKKVLEPAKLDFLLVERPYFWECGDFKVEKMKEEDYLKNREMLFSSWDARFYDNDVKLPGFFEKDKERDETEEFEDDSRMEFAIRDKENDYLGNINLFQIDYKNGTFCVSLFFLKKARKKGYAYRALALIMLYAFEELRLNKMNVSVNEGNTASENVMLRVGCEQEGRLRENVFYDGRYTDVLLFGIEKEKFLYNLTKKSQ